MRFPGGIYNALINRAEILRIPKRLVPPRLPPLTGQPITVRFQPDPRASRGELLSGGGTGREVHAGSFLRRRVIVLDSELKCHPVDLERILLHEIWHFAWLRLGNARRRSWEECLLEEMRLGAAGELGWSAQWRKEALRNADRRLRTRRWREYACESFCDTGAWLLGSARRHGEFTLARALRAKRRKWFQEAVLNRPLPL